MAQESGGTTTQNALGYLGVLYQFGRRANSLLKLIGGSGMNEMGEQVQVGASFRRVFQREFPTNVDWDLPAPAQPAHLEGANAPTATTYKPSQSKNVIQIYHETVEASYLAESEVGRLSGLAIAGGTDPFNYFGRFATQLQAALAKIANDFNYTGWNGAYANGSDPTSAAIKSRGIIPAITTNVVPAGTDGSSDPNVLTKTMLSDLYKEMLDNAGVQPEQGLIAYTNSAQLGAVSSLYETQFNQGQDRTIGGVMVRTTYTPFGVLSWAFDHDIPQDTIVFLNPDVVQGAYLPVERQADGLMPALFFEELAKVGSAEKGQIYGQLGLDYGPEWAHGKITGLGGVGS